MLLEKQKRKDKNKEKNKTLWVQCGADNFLSSEVGGLKFRSVIFPQFQSLQNLLCEPRPRPAGS